MVIISPKATRVWRETLDAAQTYDTVRVRHLTQRLQVDDLLEGWDELFDAGLLRRPAAYRAGVVPVAGVVVSWDGRVYFENDETRPCPVPEDGRHARDVDSPGRCEFCRADMSWPK